MFRGMIAGAVCLFALGLVVQSGVDGAAGEKVTIKEVMKKAHTGKPSLLKKVLAGEANADEKKQLVELYTGLSKCTPPKGDEAAFKEKAKALIDGRQGRRHQGARESLQLRRLPQRTQGQKVISFSTCPHGPLIQPVSGSFFVRNQGSGVRNQESGTVTCLQNEINSRKYRCGLNPDP